MKKYAYGVDLGGTTVKIGRFSTDGELVHKYEIPTRKEDSGAFILKDIADSIMKDLTEAGLEKDDLHGIGIDVPGPVHEEAVVNRCVNLGWGVRPVAEEMRKLTGIENVKVANDANAAALGEMWKGGGEGYTDVVMITLGTGVGGGIVLNGKIVGGTFGAAGEVGHMQVNAEETRVCGCGGTGHLEQYCSATGIAYLGTEALKNTDRPSVLREKKNLTAKHVFDAAKQGDEVAVEVAEHVGQVLGRAMASISCVIDPQIYVIGGGVSRAGSYLLNLVSENFKKTAFHASVDTKIVLAKLGNDAGMYGAVKLVLD
ncbi:MAG: ROK family glucokinase [Lachnospiraceae bacterium]|nr:ROK family glucokinase [Lachnospiraceae bacterium]